MVRDSLVVDGVEADPSDLKQEEIKSSKSTRAGGDKEQQVHTRRDLKEMLKRKADEQAGKAATKSKPSEAKAAKQDHKHSKRKALNDIQRGSECQHDIDAKFFKQSTVPDESIAAYEHNPRLPGTFGQNEAIYGRLRARADQENHATYDHDPQLPGIKGQTEPIKLRLNKRQRDESRSYDAEAGNPAKKHKMTKPTTKQLSSRTHKKHEFDAVLRIPRAKSD